MNDLKMHGLTQAQWMALYDQAGWQDSVIQACYDVASCTHAEPQDRENAMAVAGTLFANGLVSCDTWPGKKSFAEGIRDVQLSIVRGRAAPLDEDLRDQCRERMVGVRLVVNSILAFADHDELRAFAKKLAGIDAAPAGTEN